MANTIPLRKDVKESDKWNLSALFKSREGWEEELKNISPLADKVAAFKGKMASSKEALLEALKAYQAFLLKLETVYHYASLLHSSDEGDQKAADMYGRVHMAYTEGMEKISFLEPELQSIADEKIREWIESPEFTDYKVYISKLLYKKKYILSEKEERILSLQSSVSSVTDTVFSQLTNVDMNKTFGEIEVDGKKLPLTQTTFTTVLKNPNRKVREEAYKKFYKKFEENQNTISALYAGNVNQDVFISRARGYESCLHMALYSDKVPVSVYTNLIECVHKNLPKLHEFYSLKKKVLGLEELRHYDVYLPLAPSVQVRTTYDQAVEICRNALAPLGKEYTDRLCDGLKNGWVDRYENQGKRSGAFSSGAYVGDPYILLNYDENDIRDVFTMAHEGGHSMHSWYSVHNNPFMSYDYTIFEAEVASTFNEELVFEYLLRTSDSPDMKKFLLSMRADDILATLHRQTMFAEFELKCHKAVEEGQPLTPEYIRKVYRELLELYFGPEMHFEDVSDLEGLRIPHFYSAFYVYKYATGISASLALAKRVTNGSDKEREDYFKFLKSGGSRYPIESLSIAGVDMSQTKPVQDALDEFARIVDQLKKLSA
ncbi:MAG: oligoendopeptidase F [Treponema sp.]|nr:oligoendopeptidase F [Treponema sp.]